MRACSITLIDILTMKVLIVFTHPNSNSFNHALLENISEGLKESGHEVKIKDLYQESFNPVLSADDLNALHTGNTPEKIAKEQEALLWADGLIFIYPLWWYDRPAMLKGWFDSVLTNGLAFEYSNDGIKGLLTHKKAHVIITAGGTEDYFKDNDALELIHRPVTDGTLKFCGIKKVSHQIYYDVSNLTDNERSTILDDTKNTGLTF